MSWYEDANCEAASLLEHTAFAYAVDFDFPSGHVYICTWSRDLSIGGNTYQGVGLAGSISNTPERAQLTSERWTYTISGADPTVVPESEIDNCFGRSVIEYEVYINPTTHAVIGTETRREGTMGRVRRRDGKNSYIEVSCTTRLAKLEQADGHRYVTEHQEGFFSGDLGCDFTRQLDSKEIIWGGKRLSTSDIGSVIRGRFGR